MKQSIRQGAWAAVLALVACDPEVSERDVDGPQPAVGQGEDNSVLLNSFRLNSFRLNSFRLNSFRLNGDPGTDDYIEVTDVDLPGAHKPVFAWLMGSTLYMLTSKGKLLGGPQLKHTRVEFEVQEDGEVSQREISIEGVRPLAKGSDVTLYELEVRDEGGAWEPLCGEDEHGEPIAAVLLRDVWDPESGDKLWPRPSHAVTLACVDAALGKCVVWGYRPWAKLGGEPLADYHQACTRMVRADYCGNGVSYTVDGTPIHVLDPLGIEVADADVDYAVEAEWAPDGATCLNKKNTRTPKQKVACKRPACDDDAFGSGGLLQSGVVLDWN